MVPIREMLYPEELKIIKIYRFEGESDPADSTILYVIEANDGKVGYSLDAYGVYSNHDDDRYDDFIRKVPMEERDEQINLWITIAVLYRLLKSSDCYSI